MKCPKCDEAMEEGEAGIHGSWSTFMFLYGFSYQSLYFKGSEKNEELMLEPQTMAPAFVCRECKYVLLSLKNKKKRKIKWFQPEI